jgi:hypothetical protein
LVYLSRDTNYLPFMPIKIHLVYWNYNLVWSSGRCCCWGGLAKRGCIC